MKVGVTSRNESSWTAAPSSRRRGDECSGQAVGFCLLNRLTAHPRALTFVQIRPRSGLFVAAVAISRRHTALFAKDERAGAPHFLQLRFHLRHRFSPPPHSFGCRRTRPTRPHFIIIRVGCTDVFCSGRRHAKKMGAKYVQAATTVPGSDVHPFVQRRLPPGRRLGSCRCLFLHGAILLRNSR